MGKENIDLQHMRELVRRLDAAARAYYQEDKELMDNREYDELYDELSALEQESGIILSASPTNKVGYDLLSELPKERHDRPMLSLDKTKSPEALRDWLGNQTGILSWKLDGLTIVLTYEGGRLVKAVTRGNGEIGEVITNNAKVFKNLPSQIPYDGRLILRGEAVISYKDFEDINKKIENAEARYKNPRNLCSGTVRQLNNKVVAGRNVQFKAFALVSAPGVGFENSHYRQLKWLQAQGFDVVESRIVNKDTIMETISLFEASIGQAELPSDGLVLLLDDMSYGESLGQTAKFPRNSIAFKWKDELGSTRLNYIEWSASRTGLINPVAVFDPVELEGTTVSRASVHNLSILEDLKLGIGDEIMVYKANMIIPQIAENLTKSANVSIPEKCPVCKEKTQIKCINGVKSLYCLNSDCLAKRVKSLTHFVSRNALNVDGLSEATLEKMISAGFIHEFADIFMLDKYKERIVQMEGFGEKSCQNLLAAIENARTVPLYRFIYGLGIGGIGLSNAKAVCRYFDNDLERMSKADPEELANIEGVGPILAANIDRFFNDEKKKEKLTRLLSFISFEEAKTAAITRIFEGLTFVITGNVEQFANRDEVKDWIEARGGKVSGSVSKKTSYLINNDTASGSSKNKKARELGIPVISEEMLLQLA